MNVQQNVDMVALFTKDKIKPIRFRIKDQNEEYYTVTIDKVLRQDVVKVPQDSIRFICQTTLRGLMKICSIRFIKATTVWHLESIK